MAQPVQMHQKKTRWQLADDNFREQIGVLMARMQTTRRARVADEAGINRQTFYKKYNSPRTLIVWEVRLLTILFEKYGLKFDAGFLTGGEEDAAVAH